MISLFSTNSNNRFKVSGIPLPFLMGMGMLIACITAGAAGSPPTGLPTPRTTASMGVNIHFTDPAPGELEQLAAAGFKWVRMDFAWAGIEKQGAKGVYDFSAYDRLLASLDRYKIRAILILDYGNDLYEQGSPKSPSARAAFAKFAAAAVKHFHGRGVLWEMWNEPNGGFWTPRANVEEYIQLALDTGRALKAAAPDELYIGPATSGMDFTFIEKCFQAGLLRYWDAVSFHPYRDSSPETAIPDFNHVKALIAQYAPAGKSVPILSGEWGYSELYSGLSLNLQSKFIAREFLTDIANDLIVSIWYDWHDDGLDPKETEHHFGTVFNDYKPKPTYLAAQTLSRQLSGYRFNKRLDIGDPSDFCLLFEDPRPYGKSCIVAWSTRLDKHKVTLPASAGTFDSVDYTGTSASTYLAATAGLQIDIEDAPVYLKPRETNTLLDIAAQWKSLPPSIRTDNQTDALSALRPVLNGIVVSKRGRATVGLTNLTTGEPISQRQPMVDLKWQQRNIDGSYYRLTLQIPGVGQVSQQTELIPAHPLKISAATAVNGAIPVAIENPSGAALSGRLHLAGEDRSAPVKFKSGETYKLLSIPTAPNRSPSDPVQVCFDETVGPNGTWQNTAKTASLTFDTYESFSQAPDRDDIISQTYALVPDGDPKVASKQTMTVQVPPPGLPVAVQHALRIDYDFSPGWKFVRLAPLGVRRSLQDGLIAFGLWVNGDRSGCVLNMRYTDSSGQTFQTSAGTVTWSGWRYITFSFNPHNASHWGGANDGIIKYPIIMDTVTLIDSPGQAGASGTLWIADLAVIRRADK